MSTDSSAPLSIGEIAQRIHLIRGQRVVLDADLAASTARRPSVSNQQVRRNLARFPADFMFQLDAEEFAALRLQSATLRAAGASTASTCRWRSPNTARSWRPRC